MVILLTGRYAGKKAVIVRNHDDGAATRKYGHAEVLVLTKEPRKVGPALSICGRQGCAAVWTVLTARPVQVIKRSSQKKQAKRSFLKVRRVLGRAGAVGSSLLTAARVLQTTIKTVNYTHMMPTRYTLDVDLRVLFSNEVLAERKRQKETCQARAAAAAAAAGSWCPRAPVLVHPGFCSLPASCAGCQQAAHGEVQVGQEQVVLHQAQVLSPRTARLASRGQRLQACRLGRRAGGVPAPALITQQAPAQT